MTIKALIFDLGGVVFTTDLDPFYCDEFLTTFNITKSLVKKRWDKVWPLYKLAKINEREFFQQMIGRNLEKEELDKAIQLWKKYSKPIEKMPNLIKSLSGCYKTAVLSNTSKDFYKYKNQAYKIDSYFDEIVLSCNEAIAKPEEKFYQIALDRLNVDSNECFFIDDSEKNIIAAKKIQMNTILFKNQQSLEKELIKQNIL